MNGEIILSKIESAVEVQGLWCIRRSFQGNFQAFCSHKIIHSYYE